MARRRIKFKPSPREQQLGFAAAAEFMAGAAPAYKRESAEAHAAKARASVKAAPKPRGVTLHCRNAEDGGVACASLAQCVRGPLECRTSRAAPSQLEAPVVAAISELLAVHPRVIWAARFNSGAASFNAANGKYQPIWFHRFLRAPEKMRMPDFFGLLSDGGALGIPFAIEAKAPVWTKPRDDREREQAAFLAMVRNAGGIGIFACSVDDVAAALE